MMEYKGYVGKVEYDGEAEIFHGEVLGTRDVITFQGRSVDELKTAFRESIDDYLAFGVRYVWVINPRSRRAFVHTSEGSYEPKDGILRTENPEMVVSLAEIFQSLE